MGITDYVILDEQDKKFDEMAKLIEASSTIAICAHTDPDGDALGSGLGMAELIHSRWPEKKVTNLLADASPAAVPRLYRFLPGASECVNSDCYDEVPDLFIAVDLPLPSRLNGGQEVLARAKHVIVIDHHPTDCPFGDVMISRPDAAAVGVIIAEMARHLAIDITVDLATCLYCAIVTDTGRFQYQNADAEAFEIASLLVDAGASPSLISLNVYQSFRIEYLHLESIVMGRITTFSNGRIAYSYALRDDLERTGACTDECDGLVDVVRSVAGSQVCLFLKEGPNGTVRGNLRAKDAHDVSAVGRLMGGGGHVAAAGFTATGDIDEVLSRVLPLLQRLVEDKPIDEGDTRGSTLA